MAEQLMSDVLEMQEEENPLEPIEIDPVLLMTDKQIKAEVDKLPPFQKALFEDVKKFAEDREAEEGICEPVDTLMQTLIKTHYPPIPTEVVKAVVKSEIEEQQESSSTITSEKALVTAIFPSTDPVILNYNLKGKSAERTDEDYISIGDESDVEELDSIEIAQIWKDMAKLKRKEAELYDKLVAAAPTMTQSDLLYSVEKTPRPTSQLPECVEEMYERIGDPHKFRVALAAGEHLVNIYKHNRDDVKIKSIDATAHRFEVRRKDVYELLRGEKYLKPKKREMIPVEEETSTKKLKTEIPKSARRVVTTLLSPPSAEDQAAAGTSSE